MHRNDDIGIVLFQSRNGLVYVVGFFGRQMKSTNHRMNLVDADTATACLTEFTTPRWLREIITTKPRFLTLKQVASSC
jgi:hypothetical protein